MREIDSSTKCIGLLGHPVGHSVSPAIHQALSDHFGLNLVYTAHDVEPGHLKEAVEGAYALGYLGLNVTVPYKQEVMQYCCELDPVAEAIGAVNTLVRTENGFKGYNTDMPGLYRALEEEGVKIFGKEVILLGAGGVARAVGEMLLKYGAGWCYIYNRNVEKACDLGVELSRRASRHFEVEAHALSEISKLPDGKDYVVIQATSIGMAPDCDRAIVEDPAFYEHVRVGVDLIFNPFETKFMRMTREAGGKAMNGLKMLLYQGIIAYELWNDVKVDEETAKQIYPLLESILNGKQ